MLVKFNSRGAGGGSGPLDYLLGKNRDREKAAVLRGNVEQTKQLIDSLSFARNYTSGTLSFSEEDIPAHQKQEIMNDFERMIFAGLDSNQYNVLWIEHRDKDRLELNFLIPNVELQSGKRLQPYYDKVDRTLINAWQQITNDKNNFTDPHDPDRKRLSATSHDLPKNKKQLVERIKKSLIKSVENGLVENRNDVIEQLENAGFEIARKTESSISIKNPNSSRNIRLKGELYERDFKLDSKTRTAIEKTIRAYPEQRRQRIERAERTFLGAHKRKCEYNSKRYNQTQQKNSSVDSESFKTSNPINEQEREITEQRVKQNDPRTGNRIHIRSDSKRSANVSNTLSNKGILKNLKNSEERNDRIRNRVSESLSTTRTRIQRAIDISARVSRASEITNELKIERFKERRKHRAKVIERAREFSM
jgi:hypothetical protein